MLNEIIIGLAIGTLIFILIAIIVLIKLKRFESDEARNALNLFVVGLVFYFAMALFDVLSYIGVLGNIDTYGYVNIGIANNIAAFAIAPLILICFIAAVFALRGA